MPFVSQAQRRWIYENKPDMAEEWEKHTPKDSTLPEHVGIEKEKRKRLGYMKLGGKR